MGPDFYFCHARFNKLINLAQSSHVVRWFKYTHFSSYQCKYTQIYHPGNGIRSHIFEFDRCMYAKHAIRVRTITVLDMSFLHYLLCAYLSRLVIAAKFVVNVVLPVMRHNLTRSRVEQLYICRSSCVSAIIVIAERFCTAFSVGQ